MLVGLRSSFVLRSLNVEALECGQTVPLFVTLLHLSQISGRLLFGAGCSGVHASLEHHSEQGSHDEANSSAENWSVFADSALAPQAEKLIYHLVR